MKNYLIKITFSFLMVCFVQTLATAQDTNNTSGVRFGIKGGFNLSNLYTDNVDDNNILLGINAGIFAKMPVNSFVAIQPEVLFTTKGAELVYNNAFVDGTARFRLNYIEVPVLLVLNITNSINIQAGPYLAYLIDGKVSNESNGGSFDFENNIDTDDFNKIDAGLAAGLGINFDKITIGARYNYGLTKVGKERKFGGTNYRFPDGKNSVASIYLALML